MIGQPAIRLDAASAVPPFEQVRQQIADLVSHGHLPVGHRLPPVRQLAADLGLANGTVARAYQELEAAGLVVARRGGGTRVAAAAVGAPPARPPAQTERAPRDVRAPPPRGATHPELTRAVREAM